MCLAVPGKLTAVAGTTTLDLRGTVDFGGTTREISLAYTPTAKVGDYVIVHVGFALSILDEQEAQKQLELFADLNAAMEGQVRP